MKQALFVLFAKHAAMILTLLVGSWSGKSLTELAAQRRGSKVLKIGKIIVERILKMIVVAILFNLDIIDLLEKKQLYCNEFF